MQEQERRDFLEVLEDRAGSRATIVTSQLPPGQWHEHIAAARAARCVLSSSQMVEVTMQVPEELAERLRSAGAWLPAVLELGLTKSGV